MEFRGKQFVLSAILIGGSLTANGDAADQALIDAATSEGEVNWYTSFVQAQAVRPMVEAFETAYPGIKVNVTSGQVNDLLLKIMEESSAGQLQADVGHGGNAVKPLREKDLLEEYRPDSAKSFDEAYKDPAGFWTGETRYVLGASINTEEVPKEQWPKTYLDLADPIWKSRIAWTEAMAQSGPPAFIGMIEKEMGVEKGDAYLTALAANIVSVPANQRVVLDNVVLNEYSIGLMTFNHHVGISQQKGAPVDWLPLDPLIETLDTVFLLKGPHPNAGKLFIDFILSKPGQEVFSTGGYIPVNPEVDPANPSVVPQAKSARAIVFGPEEVNASIGGWIETYKRIFR